MSERSDVRGNSDALRVSRVHRERLRSQTFDGTALLPEARGRTRISEPPDIRESHTATNVWRSRHSRVTHTLLEAHGQTQMSEHSDVRGNSDASRVSRATVNVWGPRHSTVPDCFSKLAAEHESLSRQIFVKAMPARMSDGPDIRE